MNEHKCQFQVSLIRDGNVIMQSAWTTDKAAVIECVDEINIKRCRDLSATVIEHDHRRGKIALTKNGHVLITSEPFEYKNHSSGDTGYACMIVNTADKYLKAAITTKGSGGIALDRPIGISG